MSDEVRKTGDVIDYTVTATEDLGDIRLTPKTPWNGVTDIRVQRQPGGKTTITVAKGLLVAHTIISTVQEEANE